MGAESDLESTLTLGANSAMACSSTSVCWNDHEHCGLNVQVGGHT